MTKGEQYIEDLVMAGKEVTADDLKKAKEMDDGPRRRVQKAKATTGVNGVWFVGHDHPNEEGWMEEYSTIFEAIHVYQRPGESDGQIRSMATRERKMHGPGVVIFQHMHMFGLACTDACRAKIEEN